MKFDVLVAGVGGQGVVSLAAMGAEAARRSGFHVKQTEEHGMAQRGGSVAAQLRIGDGAVHSELIPAGTADLLISMEPLETLRYLPMLSRNGTVIAAAEPMVNFDQYPPIEEVLGRLRALPGCIVIETDRLAREAGSTKVTNTVLLGAASHLFPMQPERFEETLEAAFAARGEKVLRANLAGFRLGREAGACIRVS
jgi:indolepyruvate ferredoxin oxidoreductase beta subunit